MLYDAGGLCDDEVMLLYDNGIYRCVMTILMVMGMMLCLMTMYLI